MLLVPGILEKWGRGGRGAEKPGPRSPPAAERDVPLGAREAGAILGFKRELSAALPSARFTEGREETLEPEVEEAGGRVWGRKMEGKCHCNIFFVKLERGVRDTT